MRISTKGRYALRMMVYIAQNGPHATVTLREVSENQSISPKYLEQLVAPLVAAGLLKGHRGARGGYSLARSADSITAGDIVRASETTMCPVACLERGSLECSRYERCETVEFWRGLDEAVGSYMDSVSLASLAADAQARAARFEACGPSQAAGAVDAKQGHRVDDACRSPE